MTGIRESTDIEAKDLTDTSRSSGHKKILLLYASAGAGHRSACAALQHSFSELSPDSYVKMVDILDYMPRPIAHLYSTGYETVASRYPMLWYLIYESGSDLARIRPPGFWFKMFWKSALGPLFDLLKYERPHHIMSAHFLSSWAAGTYKWKFDAECKVSTVITDYGVHPIWLTPGQDFIFVATEQLRVELQPYARFLGTERIIPLGIPIHPNFGRPKDIASLKQKFKLDPGRRTILILGGMFGSRNIKDILYWLTESSSSLQLILVAGKHFPIMESTKDELIERDMKYQIFGYVDFMDELMVVSDLAITKAGALTTTECLASGLPLVIFRPYPGQEVRNCDYFLEQGAAVRIDQLSGLCYKIDSILSQPSTLAAMKERALQIAKPDAANEISRFLLELPS
jgi:processive 1,2-diacylglycerol beta-glucosyltransferase